MTETQAHRLAYRLNGALQSYMRARIHCTKDEKVWFVSIRDKSDESIEYLHSVNDKLPEYYFKTGKETQMR